MRIGVFGLGNMGSAIISGILSAGITTESGITACDVDQAKTTQAKDSLKISISSESELCDRSDLLILAVKPFDALALLGRVRESLVGKVLMSVCAGVSIANMASVIGSDKKIVRVMPNTPLLVGEGASCIAYNPHVTGDEKDFIQKLFESTGLALEVDEKLMDAVTGLSGSGPAFVFLFIEALADGGVKAGLPRDIALKLAGQTVLGSAKLLMESGKHPGELKDMVTSPAGTTIEGLSILEKASFRGSLIDAVYQAAMRSKELSGS